MIKIDYDKCCWKDGICASCCGEVSCEGCVEACPSGALERKDTLIFHADNCTSCGACVVACEHEAIRMD